MSINEQLLSIYRSKWDALNAKLKEVGAKKFKKPLLLSIDDEKYEAADIRVMIFGQETRDWITNYDRLRTVQTLSRRYHRFYELEEYYDGYKISAFWRAMRLFTAEVKSAYLTKNIYVSWNIINKIGRRDVLGMNEEAEEIERAHFDVIADEVALFKPDIVIFLTGPNYDPQIKFHFKDAKFDTVDAETPIRALAKVSSKSLPATTFRIYHPSYHGGYYKVLDKAKALIAASAIEHDSELSQAAN